MVELLGDRGRYRFKAQVYLDEGLAKWVQAEAAKRNSSVSTMVRHLIWHEKEVTENAISHTSHQG